MSLKPGTKQWARTVSASKVPVILGLSPWKSQFQLWHEMAGNVDPAQIDPNLNEIGHLMEYALVPYWLNRHEGYTAPFDTERNSYEQPFTTDQFGFPAHATVDAVATGPDGEQCIIECKTTSHLDQWGEPGDPDAVPAHYYAQVMWQMGVSGIHRADIVVDGGFRQWEIHSVEWDEEVFGGLVERAHEWWTSLEKHQPPALDDSVATYETVRGLHPDIERGREVEVDRDFALRLLDADQTEKTARSALTGLKSSALDLMGDAQYLTCEGEKIASRRAKKNSTPFIVINKNAHIGGAS